MIHAIEANLYEFYALLRAWPRVEVHDDADLLWTMTDIPFSMFNSILRAQVELRNVDSVIEKMINIGKSRNVPLLWWTGPATRPPDLGTHLERHGFRRQPDDSGMAVDLMKLNEGLPPPSGLVIEQVRDMETLKQWRHVFNTGFGFSEAIGRDFSDLFTSIGFGEELVIRHYLGRLNGEPVSCSSLLWGAGVAGIYNVATIPEARRRGVGAAITLKPLVDARAMGYRVGILQASDMGVSVYTKLGFQEYCKLEYYIWANN